MCHDFNYGTYLQFSRCQVFDGKLCVVSTKLNCLRHRRDTSKAYFKTHIDSIGTSKNLNFLAIPFTFVLFWKITEVILHITINPKIFIKSIQTFILQLHFSSEVSNGKSNAIYIYQIKPYKSYIPCTKYHTCSLHVGRNNNSTTKIHQSEKSNPKKY